MAKTKTGQHAVAREGCFEACASGRTSKSFCLPGPRFPIYKMD